MTAPSTVVTATFGGTPTALTGDTVSVSIHRGRTGPIFEDIDAGRCVVQLNNEDRTYDPLYAAGPIDLGRIRPGVSTPITVATAGTTIFTGMLGDVDIDYEVVGRTVATFDCDDDLSLLARQEFDAWTTTGQAAGARLTAILARPEVNIAGSTSFATGISGLQADSVTWGSNVLNYCQLVSRSDLGFLYVSRAGVLTFKDRHSVATGTVECGFTDGSSSSYATGGTVRFHKVGTAVGSELFYNRVGVDREGGTKQTATNASNGSADGFRSLSLTGLLVDSDATSLAIAQFLLGRYQEPETRITRITSKLHGLTPTEQNLVLGLDITSLVAVTWAPNGVGDPIDRVSVVQGITHTISPGFHEVTLSLGDVSRQAVFTLDDAVYGVLDSDASVLTF